MVDFFPFCKLYLGRYQRHGHSANPLPVKKYPMWAPGSGFVRKAMEVRELVQNMINAPYDMVKRKLVRFIIMPTYP